MIIFHYVPILLLCEMIPSHRYSLDGLKPPTKIVVYWE